MIDLSYKPRKKAKAWEAEEIACAVLAIVIWITLAILFLGAL